VLNEACRRTKGWQQSYPRSASLRVIVNFSAKQLRHPGCVEDIEEALRESGLGAEALSLDITESAFVDTLENNALVLRRIENLGVGICIDDFGTGYSSLSYLKRLPADVLKIDKSFVKGLGEDDEDTAITRMIVELAHTLGMQVIAEGVETDGQVALLEEMGCDMAQGFHFEGAVPPGAVSELLLAR
jgi:EAL domain-containing protein (putative c-di-GMP-specific phosphodiesterase class I)